MSFLSAVQASASSRKRGSPAVKSSSRRSVEPLLVTVVVAARMRLGPTSTKRAFALRAISSRMACSACAGVVYVRSAYFGAPSRRTVTVSTTLPRTSISKTSRFSGRPGVVIICPVNGFRA